MQIRLLLLRMHKRYDRWKVVRQRESSQGQVRIMRHNVSGVVAARGVQMSQTDRGAQGVAGGCSVGAGRSAIAASRGHKTVPPPPEEMSSIACPTHWTHVHYASTSALWSDGQKCASPLDWRALPRGRLGSEKSTMYISSPNMSSTIEKTLRTAQCESSTLCRGHYGHGPFIL